VAPAKGSLSLTDGGNRNDALFLSCNGRRLSGTDIFRILQGYADAAGVKVSPDRVRHSGITAFFYASGGDVR
jgi:site-specific recombinase XerD